AAWGTRDRRRARALRLRALPRLAHRGVLVAGDHARRGRARVFALDAGGGRLRGAAPGRVPARHERSDALRVYHGCVRGSGAAGARARPGAGALRARAPVAVAGAALDARYQRRARGVPGARLRGAAQPGALDDAAATTAVAVARASARAARDVV